MIVINQTNFVQCKPIPVDNNLALNFNLTITIILANCIWNNKDIDNLTSLNRCLSNNCELYCTHEYNKLILYSNSGSCLELSRMHDNCIQNCKSFSMWLKDKNKISANLEEQSNENLKTIKSRFIRHVQEMVNLTEDDKTLETSDIIIIVSFGAIMLILIVLLYRFFTHNFDLIKSSTIKIVSIKKATNGKQTIPSTTPKFDSTKSNLKSKIKNENEKITIKINL